jgi:uncharacterized phage infection (PIP) family protein YhgE
MDDQLAYQAVPMTSQPTSRVDLRIATNRTQPAQWSTSSSSAGTAFRVDPDQYRAAVSPMAAAADQLAHLATNLAGFLSSMESNAPWGKDESGKHFAEGDKGYRKYSADSQQGLKSLPDGLHFIADGLKAMAEGYRDAEDAANSALDQQDARLQQDQVMPASPNLPGSPTPRIPRVSTLGAIAQGHPSQTGRP